jgi:hypothetical protein
LAEYCEDVDLAGFNLLFLIFSGAQFFPEEVWVESASEDA